MAVVIVDTEERVRAFLPELDGLRPAGLVTLERCEVLRYAGPDGAAGHGTREGGA